MQVATDQLMMRCCPLLIIHSCSLQVRREFITMDGDGNGSVSADEFAAWMARRCDLLPLDL